MALARDVTGSRGGGFSPRGLSDFPESSAAGSAARARNVEFWAGSLTSRRGFKYINRLDYQPQAVDLAYEFRGCSNLPMLVTVGRSIFSPYTFLVRAALAGDKTAIDYASFAPSGVRTGMPSVVEFEGDCILFLPVDGANPTMFRLHREADPYWEVLVPETPGAEAQLDGDADSGAHRDGATQIVRGVFGCAHENRLFVVEADSPTRIRYSDMYEARWWAALNSWGYEGNSEPIVALASAAGLLLAWTRHQMFATEFTGQDSYEHRVVHQHTGALSHRAMVQASGHLWYLSDEGLLAMNLSNLYDVKEASEPIKRTLERYRSGFERATLVHYAAKHQLWLHIPTAPEVFVYDIRTGDWSTVELAGGLVRPLTVGLSRYGGRDVPIFVHAYDKYGWVTRGERSDSYPYLDDYAVDGYRARFHRFWLSLPLSTLGRHQRRRWRRIRPQLVDQNDQETLRFFWCVEGQSYEDAIDAGQYQDVTLASPRSIPRGRDDAADPDAWIGGLTVIPSNLGEREFSTTVSLSGQRRGAWVQIGVEATGNCNAFELRSFELDTRIEPGRRR